MPRTPSVSLHRTLRKLLPESVVAEAASSTGAFQRIRKVDAYDFVWSLILGFSAGKVRTIAGLRRAFERATGTTLEESSFYARFTPALVRLLRQLLDGVIDQSWGLSRAASGRLRQFRDILVADSTVIRLHDLLAGAFPGCRTNHTRAAAKVHVLMCVAGAGKQTVKVTGERRHDRRAFVLGPWVRGKLLLFDLGFFDFGLFRRIEDLGGHFVSRLKRSSNPVIVAQNRLWRGRSIPVVGQRIWDVVEHLQREELDVLVQVRARHRVYAGSRSSEVRTFRVVGLRDEASGDYHLYITDISVDALAPTDISRVYAVRWEVELLFKELKSQYRLDQVPSRKRPVVEAMLYAALLSLAASRALLREFRAVVRAGLVVPARRWSIVLAQHAVDLLHAVLHRRDDPDLVGLFLHEAPDPNRRRPHLVQSVEQGVHAYRTARTSAVSRRKVA
ncbi:MAG: IS4 family transposase [Deltaproteobacteria bacterium]|nr:IS4 family transposase [Deltaproteobacteria bacterium]